FWIGLPQRFSTCIAANSIHQNIEMAMAGGNAIHHGPARSRVRGIQRQKLQMSVGANRVLQGVRLVLLDIGGNHGCALVQQGKRYSPAQSAGASGDKSYFSCEFTGHVDASSEPLSLMQCKFTLFLTHQKV